MAEKQKTTAADATPESGTPALAAAPSAAAAGPRRGVLATVGISVGSVVAALALFGGGVALGANVPHLDGPQHAAGEEGAAHADGGPMAQHRGDRPGQQNRPDARPGQPGRPGAQQGPMTGEQRGGHPEPGAPVDPSQLPPGMMGEGPAQPDESGN